MMMLISVALSGQPTVAAVEQFVKAGDTRDTAALESVMHDSFRVVARMPDGISVMDRSTYLGLIESEKIGGTPRRGTFELVTKSEDIATVKGTLDSSAAHFDCTWTVVRNGDGWQVIQDVVVFTPKAK